MSKSKRKIFLECFRHFSERLALRYNILITFEDYEKLCALDIKVIGTDRGIRNKIIALIGILEINGVEVNVVKSIKNSKKTPLITALPKSYIFKKDEKWVDKTSNVTSSEESCEIFK